MIKVTVGIETLEYAFIDDFMEDYVDDELVEEWLNEIYEPYQICGFSFSPGTIMRKCLGEDSSEWERLREDFIQMESEYVEDELETSGGCDWYSFHIIDTDYVNES